MLQMKVNGDTVRFQRVEQDGALLLGRNHCVIGLLIRTEIVLRQNYKACAAIVPGCWAGLFSHNHFS
jgi:hypothetical protein